MNKRVRLPSHVWPMRYKVMLRPDFTTFTFSGEETITIQIDKSTKSIILHARELEIDAVELKGVGRGKVSYQDSAETATFTFLKSIPKGQRELKLIFRGVLNNKMRGFYRSRYLFNGVEKHLATTQFEVTDARRAIPCFDEPSHKAIFDITLMVPSHMEAISNTLPNAVWEHEKGVKVVQFLPTPKMSTYLLAFIVGEFEYIEAKTKRGITVRVFTTLGKKHQAQFALDFATSCLQFYEDYFAIPYPLPVLDLIAIPDFATGAMENWGAVTYRESTLLIDENESSLRNKQTVAIVIAHELAHQWFGNLVTMEWWNDLWLNEGFASFIEYLAVDHLFPKWDIWTQFVYLDMGVALALDGLKNSHPVEVKVDNPSQIGEIFDKVSYSKGSSILRMLASYLGDKDFREGLRCYLKKYAYKNAKTEDLWKAFEEVSGKKVGAIMKNWTGKAGYPVINVKIKNQNSKLQLAQSRFFSSPISEKKTRDNTIWKIPLGELLIDQKSITTVNRGEKLNKGETNFIRVNYPAKYWQILGEGVSSKKLATVDRLGLIRDVFALSEAGKISTANALKFALVYQDEEDYTVWAELVASLIKLSHLLTNEIFYDNYKAYCRGLLTKIVSKLDWQPKEDEKHTDTLLRELVLFALGIFGDQKIIKRARQLFDNHIKGEKIAPNLRSVIYQLAAENGGKQEYDKLISLYQREELHQEKDRIGRALGSFHDKKMLRLALDFSISQSVRNQDVVFIIGRALANPFGRDLAWRFIKNHWKMLYERYRSGYLLSRMISQVSDFTTQAKAREIEGFFKTHSAPELTRTVAQVLEQISSNIAWLARDKKKLGVFLQKFARDEKLMIE